MAEQEPYSRKNVAVGFYTSTVWNRVSWLRWPDLTQFALTGVILPGDVSLDALNSKYLNQFGWTAMGRCVKICMYPAGTFTLDTLIKDAFKVAQMYATREDKGFSGFYADLNGTTLKIQRIGLDKQTMWDQTTYLYPDYNAKFVLPEPLTFNLRLDRNK